MDLPEWMVEVFGSYLKGMSSRDRQRIYDCPNILRQPMYMRRFRKLVDERKESLL